MTGRNQTPRTPLMVDAHLVEIARLLSRARDVASEVDRADPDTHLRGSVNHAYVEAQRRLAAHRREHDLGDPNH
jgi:hypothetical protein